MDSLSAASVGVSIVEVTASVTKALLIIVGVAVVVIPNARGSTGMAVFVGII
jgi:hypothetical protein